MKMYDKNKNLYPVRSGFYYFLLAVLVSLYSCNGKNEENNGVLIEGTIKNAKRGTMVYLEELSPKNRIKIDSTIISGEQFTMRVFPKEAGFYIISLSPKEFVTLLIDSNDTKIEFSADVSKELYSNYDVKGSSGSELILELNRELAKSYKTVDSLQKIFAEKKEDQNFLSIKTILDSLYFEVLFSHRKYLEGFIQRNLGSLSTIIALYQQIGRNSLFNPDDDAVLFIKVDSALQKTIPNSQHAVYLHEKAMEIRKKKSENELLQQQLSIGGNFPDINLTEPGGKLRTLSSLKGSVVLVDFWASWCKPCRIENPNLVKLYKKYKKKGLEIFAVSLDKDLEEWKDAIKKDKLDWIHVSDLGYRNSIVVKSHNVNSVPMNYLLDREGKVIARELYGDELERVVKEFFEKEKTEEEQRKE